MVRKVKPTPREVMSDRIEASRRNVKPSRMITINWEDLAYSVVNRAAKERGISKSAYVRRAAVSLACVDLGLSYDEVMETERGTRPYGETGGRPQDLKTSLKGKGYGKWKITGLE